MKRIIALLLLALLLAGCGGKSELVGLWLSVDMPGQQYEFNADGTGVVRWSDHPDDETAIAWEVDGDEVCFTFDDGSSGCRPFRVDGDRMAIELYDGSGMVPFERWTD